jgi:hypothetical protein
VFNKRVDEYNRAGANSSIKDKRADYLKINTKDE